MDSQRTQHGAGCCEPTLMTGRLAGPRGGQVCPSEGPRCGAGCSVEEKSASESRVGSQGVVKGGQWVATGEGRWVGGPAGRGGSWPKPSQPQRREHRPDPAQRLFPGTRAPEALSQAPPAPFQSGQHWAWCDHTSPQGFSHQLPACSVLGALSACTKGHPDLPHCGLTSPSPQQSPLYY